MQVKIRRGDKVWFSKAHEIKQNCPTLTRPDVLLAILAVVLILITGITIYIK
jgi:hypothetical protein